MNPEEAYILQSTVNLINFYADKLKQIHAGAKYGDVMPRKADRGKMRKYGIIERVKTQAYRVKLSDFAIGVLELE